jgi:hypothetical protein
MYVDTISVVSVVGISLFVVEKKTMEEKVS